MKNPLRFLAVAFAFTAATLAPAQVTFTVTATAGTTTQGYVLGNSYTFIYTTVPNFTTLANSAFSASAWEWKEEQTTVNQLWSSVGGTGLLGSFVRPAGTLNDPYSYVGGLATLGIFELGANTDALVTTTTGLTTLSGTSLRATSASMSGGTLPTFAYSASSPSTDLATYYSAYVGTYSGFSAGQVKLRDSVSNSLLLNFDITSVEISVIPEPSTYAAALAAVALAVAAYHRRKRPIAAARN